MKVFLQAQDESIVINGDITLTVLKIEGDQVVLGIDAPEMACGRGRVRVAIGDHRGRGPFAGTINAGTTNTFGAISCASP